MQLVTLMRCEVISGLFFFCQNFLLSHHLKECIKIIFFNFRLMQAVSQHTRVNPDGRIQRLLDFNRRLIGTEASTNALREWGLDIERQLVDVPARILPPEKILFGENR